MNTYGRIYEKFSFMKLLRLKSFFLTCRFPFVVSNLGRIYELSTKILGRRIVNNLIKNTYGDIFLAGENCKDLENLLKLIKKEGLISIADYAREFLTKEEEEKDIGEIIIHYKDSIDASSRVDKENSIAMKISSFGDVETLKYLNACQFTLTLIEKNIDKSYQELLDIMEGHKLDVKLSQLNYEKLRNMQGKVFSLNFYELLLSENEDDIYLIKSLLGIRCKQFSVFKKFAQKLNERLMQVFSHAEKSKCLVMVDAEQSYLRYISDMIVAYYFKMFNNDSCIIAQTLQCYLKTQQQDLLKWYEFTQSHNLKFGLKIVRGAYMNEEENIAKRKGIDSNINDNIESTHSHYNKSIDFLFNHYKNGDKVSFL